MLGSYRVAKLTIIVDSSSLFPDPVAPAINPCAPSASALNVTIHTLPPFNTPIGAVGQAFCFSRLLRQFCKIGILLID